MIKILILMTAVAMMWIPILTTLAILATNQESMAMKVLEMMLKMGIPVLTIAAG
jgi:hypothetical protein